MEWIGQNWEAVISIVLAVATVIGGPSAHYIIAFRKVARELVEVIDDARSPNKAFQQLAADKGRKAAVKALAKLA